ncbi:MAG: hypothetical protein V9H26_02250 [Verrucomicrobiota bacterium]
MSPGNSIGPPGVNHRMRGRQVHADEVGAGVHVFTQAAGGGSATAGGVAACFVAVRFVELLLGLAQCAVERLQVGAFFCPE